MLERLRIQNFKSWQDAGDMAFGSLTGNGVQIEFLCLEEMTMRHSPATACKLNFSAWRK